MNRFISIAALAALLIFAVSVLSGSAKPPAITAVKKESVKLVNPTIATAACEEQVILNEQLTAKVTGVKPLPEATARFDFKIDAVVKPLDGHADAVEHVPIDTRSAHPPVGDGGSFY